MILIPSIKLVNLAFYLSSTPFRSRHLLIFDFLLSSFAFCSLLSVYLISRFMKWFSMMISMGSRKVYWSWFFTPFSMFREWRAAIAGSMDNGASTQLLLPSLIYFFTEEGSFLAEVLWRFSVTL
jgi:hypothetical protein